jgi:hypothetical protein
MRHGMKGLEGQRADLMFQWQPWRTNCATTWRFPTPRSRGHPRHPYVLPLGTPNTSPNGLHTAITVHPQHYRSLPCIHALPMVTHIHMCRDFLLWDGRTVSAIALTLYRHPRQTPTLREYCPMAEQLSRNKSPHTGIRGGHISVSQADPIILGVTRGSRGTNYLVIRGGAFCYSRFGVI